MKKFRIRGFLAAKREAKKLAILKTDTRREHGLVIAAALCGAIMAAAIGALFMWSGGQ